MDGDSWSVIDIEGVVSFELQYSILSMSDYKGKKEVLFDLSDDALYVANSGRIFTRNDVIGICASHLSEKRGNHPDDYKYEDKDLTSCIRERDFYHTGNSIDLSSELDPH